MPNMKPVQLMTGRSYTVAQKMARAESEEAFKVGRAKLVPPDELTERAKNKFEQIVAEAFWLDELSVDLLAAYCQVWDRWLDTIETMKGMEEITIQRNAKGEVTVKDNPYRGALRTYVSMMNELSGKLALGNIDRLRLSASATDTAKQQPKKNPFEDFMSEVE